MCTVKVKYEALSVGELLKEVKQLLVRSRNKLVHWPKLGTMTQDGEAYCRL